MRVEDWNDDGGLDSVSPVLRLNTDEDFGGYSMEMVALTPTVIQLSGIMLAAWLTSPTVPGDVNSTSVVKTSDSVTIVRAVLIVQVLSVERK